MFTSFLERKADFLVFFFLLPYKFNKDNLIFEINNLSKYYFLLMSKNAISVSDKSIDKLSAFLLRMA